MEINKQISRRPVFWLYPAYIFSVISVKHSVFPYQDTDMFPCRRLDRPLGFALGVYQASSLGPRGDLRQYSTRTAAIDNNDTPDAFGDFLRNDVRANHHQCHQRHP